MKFTALKNNIKEGGERIYLFEGEENYFIERGMEMLKSAFISEPSLNYSVFEGASLKGPAAEDFVSAVYAYPFMSEKRMVRVNNLFPAEKDYERIKTVFESPCESTVLVVVNTAKPKAGSVDLKKKPNVAFVDCSKANEEDVLKWIYVTMKRAGVAADSSVCNLIASYCGFGMSRVCKETEKLIFYAGEGGRVSADDVEAIVYKETDYKMYELTSAVVKKNYTLFVSIAEDMLSKGYDEMSFLSALGNYYKNLYDCFVSEKSDAETAKLMGVKEYAVKKNRQQAGRIGKDALKKYCSVFYDAVADIKSGNVSMKSALAVAIAKIFFED